MRKVFMFLGVLLVFAFTSKAQQVSGVVKDEQGKGVEKATISLLLKKDSSVIKFSVSGATGKYSFSSVPAGEYLVSTSYVGYVPKRSSSFQVSGNENVTVPDIVVERTTSSMAGVTVTSKKPIVEVKADKTVLNIEGTINAIGNDALELLRKSPGVVVDKDDNISLMGKNGVKVYIDGKPSPLSGTDLSNYLKSIQSSQVESIELITNPSAKYDAAGNAGIINIKFKKNKAFGTNGSVNAGYNIGTYPKYNAGVNFNNRNKIVNLFGSYNYNDSKQENIFNLNRTIGDTAFESSRTMPFKNKSHNFKAGADFYIDKKNTFGVLVNGNFSDGSMNGDNINNIIYRPTNTLTKVLKANNTNDMNRKNVNFNLNYRFADTAGHELNMDLDYGLFRLNNNQLQPNYYYAPDGTTLLNKTIYRFLSPSTIDLYTFKTDYEQNFKKGRLGIGAKFSVVNTDNNFKRYDVSQLAPSEIKTLDVPKSNEFDYKENINAVYVNYNRQLKGKMIQFGVRMENTVSSGNSYGLNNDGSVNKGSKQTFKRNYTDLFPSAAITFNKNPMNQWGLSYSRRIDRPAYQDLNPFEFKLDEYSYKKGNVNLKPQYTNVFSLTNTYKFKLTTSLTYSHINDMFAQIVDTTEQSKSFITTENLAKSDVYAVNISYPFMYKTYTAFVNLSGNYSKYKADFGGGNRVVNLDAASFNIYMQHSYKFGKKREWTAEVSGWYNSPMVWQGFFKSKSMWTVDAGMQKTIFKGKGTFKLSVSDIFHSLKFDGHSDFAGQYTQANGSFESRQLKASLVWRFGSSTVKAARQRKDASEDEKKRTQSSGGGGIGASNK
ncbi:MAG: TonB-dependent receptor [Bacteroidetes bacterium]|nr:TonB-dependent receptor [Bacteroidota bacterium]